PKVRVLKVEEIGCELRQLAGAHERSGVHQERRENLRVAMLARVDVQKEISEGPLEPCAPSLVHGEPRSGNLRGRRQIQNPGPLPNFPMRLWLEVNLRSLRPAADFYVVSSARSRGHRRV